jgi:hypothetical protein
MGPTISLHTASLRRLLFSNSAVSPSKSICSLPCLRAIKVSAGTELQGPVRDLLTCQTLLFS